MVIGPIIREAIRYGTKYFPETVKAFNRFDVRVFKGLYGASGGRGIRHGRDAGSIIAGTYRGYDFDGDDVEDATVPGDGQKGKTRTSQKYKTRSRYKRNYSSSRGKCYRRNQGR